MSSGDAQETLRIETGVIPGLDQRNGDGFVAAAIATAAAKLAATYLKAAKEAGRVARGQANDAPT